MNTGMRCSSFPFYYHKVILFQGQVTEVIDKIISGPLFGGIEGGKQIKIEPLVQQPGPSGGGLASFQGETAQDAVILPQAVVYIADEVGSVLVAQVVPGIPAMVRAEFLIYPSQDIGATFQAVSFGHGIILFPGRIL